jgi:bifunctional UDP-N-acetylglucosamine pyrophosphorylase/glucosamine-1-phosphate N-acetyltransferase
MALQLVGAGLGLRDPGRIDLRGQLTFGRNVFIDVGVMIIGDVILEDGVNVGSNCILENCRIRAGSMIKDFSMVSGATVGAGCRIGPYARIRPDSILGRGCHIGNFVEIKKTTMGRGCKINHHSFIGDAALGNEVIIGAGSMTCNHDGSKVNRTRIHDGAYIGSGVMLVAPVTVGRKAFVGAGSTIVATAPANSLTLGRARQISIKGWVKKSRRKKNQNAKSKK